MFIRNNYHFGTKLEDDMTFGDYGILGDAEIGMIIKPMFERGGITLRISQ